jgi:hypothetical protein
MSESRARWSAAVDDGARSAEDLRMSKVPPAGDDDPDPTLDLDPREAARARRRDHAAEAERRDLMRPGMGKVFKQITDSWGEKAARDVGHESRGSRTARHRH